MPSPFSHGAPVCRTRHGSTTTRHAMTKHGTSTLNETLDWMPDHSPKLSSGRTSYRHRTRLTTSDHDLGNLGEIFGVERGEDRGPCGGLRRAGHLHMR